MPGTLAPIFAFLGLLGYLVLLGSALLWLVPGRNPQAGWLSVVLTLLSMALVVIGQVIAVFQARFAGWPRVNAAILSAGALGIICGLLIRWVESRSPHYPADRSLGILVAGAGLLFVVSSLFLPVLPGQFNPVTTTANQSAVVGQTPTIGASATLRATPTDTTVPTIVSTATPSVTPSPSPLPSPTPTRERYSTRTPTPTATITRFCGAVVNYNLNLRQSPERDAAILLVIPYNSIVNIGARNPDGDWWFVEYNDVWGWVVAEYINPEQACSRAPVLSD